LLIAEEKLDPQDPELERLRPLLELGEPNAEVGIAYLVWSDSGTPTGQATSKPYLEDLKSHCLKRATSPEVQRLGRTIRTWFRQKLCNGYIAKVSNIVR
jgi:hypothetical protein